MEVVSTRQQETLTRNLAVLRAVSPRLAERLETLGPDRVLPLMACDGPDGSLTARVRCEDGCEVLLASRRGPAVEAKRWADSLDVDDEDVHTLVLTGCGLGYRLAELLGRRRGGLVVVLEPSLATVHAALRCHDFTADLMLRRLALVVAESRAEMFAPLGPHNVEIMLGTRLLGHPVSLRVAPEACGRIQADFTDYIHYAQTALVTAVGISARTCRNILGNLPYYLGWPDIAGLKGAWAGRPGVCVAAGPSLRKNMHLLADLRDVAAVISAQTMLRPLLSAGIRPRFVTALDYSEQSLRFYEGLPDLDDITLVADPKVNAVVPRSFPGPVRMFANSFAQRALTEMEVSHDTLPAGTTVAHLNFYLARYLGCDPIILVGQDLAFGENIYYSPGCPIQKTWSPEFNRFNSVEMMEWQRIVRNRQMLRKVHGQTRKEIYSNAQMFTYLQQFERDIADTDARVINATEGGARIAGTDEMSLAEAVQHYGRSADSSPVEPARPLPDAAQRLTQGAKCLDKRLDELDQMDEICQKVLKPLRQMTDALDDPSRFNRLHAKMDRWRVKIDSLSRIYQLVADATQLAELKRLQMDMAQQRKDLDEIATRRDQLARDIQYVTILQEGVEFLREAMREAAGKLREGVE